MYLRSIPEFFAHLHPALVHLPIGILLIALLLKLLSGRQKYASLRPAVAVTLMAGLCCAVLSCITGFLLFRSGDYDEELVSWHMWMAIASTFLSFVLWAKVRFQGFDRNSSLMGIGLFVLVVVTGHLGGSLTHGEDYLTSPFRASTPPPVFHPITDVQQAVVYGDIIQPILEARCNNCHGAHRQKGGLRLDDPGGIAKGGRDGLVLVAGKPDSSELIKRILLPESDEHHMPPKNRPQVTAQEQLLLIWWVSQGSSYNKKVNELAQSEKVKAALTGLQGAGSK